MVGLEELREGDEEEGGEADRRGGLRVEGVDLVAQAGGEGGVFDLGELCRWKIGRQPRGREHSRVGGGVLLVGCAGGGCGHWSRGGAGSAMK